MSLGRLLRPSRLHSILPIRDVVQPHASMRQWTYTSVRCRAYDAANTPLRNNKIPYPSVYLVDPVTGKLGPDTVEMKTIMAGISRATHFVELVAHGPKPIVKIISKADARARETAAKRTRQAEDKEIHCSWNMEPGDMSHKMAKAVEELKKGNRVELVFSTKAREKPLPKEDQEAVLEEMFRLLGEDVVELSRLWERGTLRIHLRPRSRPEEPEADDPPSKAEAPANESKVKEISSTWDSPSTALDYKIRKAREELRKGHNVDFTFHSKDAGTMALSLAEKHELLDGRPHNSSLTLYEI
ncbi:hypothetical protein SISNIDRAFT_509409 [Sistotremastrum niveocremeum HHB9708]|uniref:Translation initiation factor 3 N-terminal domain-containing protein n=1 Tax=Sistotremastrum niveocremeum HHB9708 TaxID=1314777 RepID=A0A164TT78_9AGAM|nr:hypothetical protein SISNIDRAFT_509409 [Sistotremastrum niveocremeum HHB9708]